MAIARIHPHFHKAVAHVDDPSQHEAVVDLLVLAVYSNATIDQVELDALDEFDASHADWDEGPFSIQQYLPSATAKVRAALDTPQGRAAMLSEIAGRITVPTLRKAAVGYCEELVAVDGISVGEREFLDQVGRALGDEA